MRQNGQLSGHAAGIILFAISFLLLLSSSPAAQEPVSIIIQGLDRDENALKNVQAALVVPEGMIQDGRVNRLWFERFSGQAEEKVRRALEPFGYYNSIVDVSVERRDENNYILRVTVNAGDRVEVTHTELKLAGPGAGERELKNLISDFPLREGNSLRQQEYEKAKADLRAKAIELGYLDASFSVHEIRIHRAESTAGIYLTLETGPRYLFGETDFENLSEYPEPFMRRFIIYKKGEFFSYAKLGETQLNLINSDRFSEVVISPEKDKAEDLHIPVRIRLAPAPSRRLRLGLGYGTDTGARFSVRYRDLNMLQRGHELTSEIDLSEKLQGFGAAYRVPSSRNIDSFTEAKFNLKREDIDTYTNTLTAFEINRTRSFRRGSSAALYLRVQHEDFTIGDEKTTAFMVLPGVRMSKLRYDDPIRPRKGYRYGIDLRGTHQVFGSDTGLIQIIADGGSILPLPLGLSLLTRLRAGFTLQNEPLEAVPVSLRFFAGGDRSVRGYGYQTLGPEDQSGDVIGGKHIVVGSVELERQITGNWGAAVFYDAGNAFNSLSEIRLFQGAGIGLRYYSRVGAVKLDVARQIEVDNPDFRLHFTVGAEF